MRQARRRPRRRRIVTRSPRVAATAALERMALVSLYPRSAIPSDRKDIRATTCDEGAATAAGVASGVSGGDPDVFVFGDPDEKIAQDGAAALPAVSALDRAWFGGEIWLLSASQGVDASRSEKGARQRLFTAVDTGARHNPHFAPQRNYENDY